MQGGREIGREGDLAIFVHWREHDVTEFAQAVIR